ncbi:MAG: gliding motility-associated C-terminal domain-containing protein [Bacteroidales bacterium]|nr:gliding motility-associated C-terminal domain-containing protein [Bacteroidales bacterium]
MKKIICILLLLISLSYLSAQNQPLLPNACGGTVEKYRVAGGVDSDFYWEIEGGEVVKFYNDSVYILWNSKQGMAKITVTETNIYGCEGEPYYQTLLVTSPYVDIGLDEVNICEGETHTFIASSKELNYIWQDGETTGETFVASETGDYWVRVVDENGCVGADTAKLIVHDLPIVDLGKDTVLCNDQELEFDVSDIDGNYEWFDGSASPFYTVGYKPYNQKIWVKIVTPFGCENSDTVIVRFCGKFKIPNAFTPNNDNINDTWVIEELQQYPDAVVNIYNRWGDGVFQSNKNDDFWDGRNMEGKKLPMDTYYYVIELNNGAEPIVGTVTLIR